MGTRVRDFDPTLNSVAKVPHQVPIIKSLFNESCILDNPTDSVNRSKWSDLECDFFNKHEQNLLVIDDEGQEYTE